MQKYCYLAAENLKEQVLTLSLFLLDCVITTVPIQSKGNQLTLNLCPHTVYSTAIDSPLCSVNVIFFCLLIFKLCEWDLQKCIDPSYFIAFAKFQSICSNLGADLGQKCVLLRLPPQICCIFHKANTYFIKPEEYITWSI